MGAQFTPPPPKYGKSIFFGQMSCKIRSYLFIFMHILSDKNVLPPKFTARLRPGACACARACEVNVVLS